MSEGEPGGVTPEPVESGTTPEAPAGRPLNLSILLIVIVLLNALGVVRGLGRRDELMAAIPKFTPLLFGLWTAAQAIAVAGGVGLWLQFRWGLYLLGLSWALTAFADIRLGATGHAIIVTGVFWLVVLFVRPVRAALR